MPIPLRADFDVGWLGAAVKRSKDGPQARRLLALAAIYEGASRTEAAKIGGVTPLQIRDCMKFNAPWAEGLIDWVMKFNAHGPEGLIDCKPPGQPFWFERRAPRRARRDTRERPDPGRMASCAGGSSTSPMDLRGIPRRRRQADIEPGIARHGIVSSARPRHHEQAERARSRILKSRAWTIGREKGVEPAAIEVWFADEARIGQKNKITRRWAKRGTRPSAPTDQRTASAYIFGAICPKHGKGAALIMPSRNTEAMNLHLAEIAVQIALAHAALLVDQAGWHLPAGSSCRPTSP